VQGQRQMGMRSIREWLLAGTGAGGAQETAARGVEGERKSGDGGRQETETAGVETRQRGDHEGAGGLGATESSASPATGGHSPGREEGTGVVQRQAGGLGAGVEGGTKGDFGSGARPRGARNRGQCRAPSLGGPSFR